MPVRSVILLDRSNRCPELAGILQTLDWRVSAVSSLKALSDPRTCERGYVGLLVLDDTALEADVEKLPLSDDLDWLAVVPAALVGREGWSRVLVRNFFDHLTLPLDVTRLSTVLSAAQAWRESRATRQGGPEGKGRYGLIGRSPPMLELFRLMSLVVDVDAPVLITGESGTGKELIARALHQHSERHQGPFVAVNCGGLSEGLIHSELFGHERGAFNGAHQRRIGSIEAAAGGVVFLDEIGDLPLALQAHLLRFLQDRTILRVGSSRPTHVDVRVVAATHVDLIKAVALGRFHEELLNRLNVVRVEAPPLRQRGEDIELLARALWDDPAMHRSPSVRGVSHAALKAMRQYHWPGNVRELINRMQLAMLMSNGRLLGPEDLDLTPIIERKTLASSAGARRRLERDIVRAALESNRHNVSRTARALGISRVTLYRLFEKFDIERA